MLMLVSDDHRLFLASDCRQVGNTITDAAGELVAENVANAGPYVEDWIVRRGEASGMRFDCLRTR